MSLNETIKHENTENHIINSVLFPLERGSSGWQDSNLRPPRPKRGAITGLRYTPKWLSTLKKY